MSENMKSYRKKEFLDKKFGKHNFQTKFKAKQRLKLLFTTICSAVLMYQTIELLTDYLSFDTIVATDIEFKSLTVELPGVSVCQRSPNIHYTFDQNVKAVQPMMPRYARRMIEQGYITRNNETLTCDLRSSNPMSKSFFKLNETHLASEEFEDIRNESIGCVLYDFTTKCGQSFESISYLTQCRTYLSRIASNAKTVVEKTVQQISDYQLLDIEQVMAYFYINFTDLYLNRDFLPEMRPFIVIQTSRGPPKRVLIVHNSRRLGLKPNKYYGISFTRKTIAKLPKPYKTDCQFYEPDLSSTDIYGLSRDLCITKCKNEEIYSKLKCILSTNDIILGQKYSELPMCGIVEEVKPERGQFENQIYNKCRKQCKQNCFKELFDLDIYEVEDKEMALVFGNDKNEPNISYFAVLNKLYAQTHSYHLPRIKFIDFLSNIGGLMGLWLGLSVITLFDYLSLFCSALKIKFKSYFN